MKIIRDRENTIYSLKNRRLGNCFTVVDEHKEIHYEFDIQKQEAMILTKDKTYIEEVIQEFRFYNYNITTFYTKDRSFYKSFEPVFTFKLPLQVIQPSQFFIDKEKLSHIETYLKPEEIYIPVAIIQDEYVSLDGHTRLYYLYQNDVKMVNVYLDSYHPHILDFIYLAKENNLFKISNLKLLEHEEYVTYWDGFCDDYFNHHNE